MKVHFAVALAALSAIVGWAQSSPRQSQTLPELQHIDVMQVDNAIDPCANFYQYACGKLNAANPIPPDQMSWGPDGKLTEWNRLVLRQTLEKTQAASASRTANEQKIGDFYTCGDPATAPAH
jgi:endothelin-converting enzyme/putative endopeptidase